MCDDISDVIFGGFRRFSAEGAGSAVCYCLISVLFPNASSILKIRSHELWYFFVGGGTLEMSPRLLYFGTYKCMNLHLHLLIHVPTETNTTRPSSSLGILLFVAAATKLFHGADNTLSVFRKSPPNPVYRGLLQKKGCFETYLPVGTFPRGWNVLEE